MLKNTCLKIVLFVIATLLLIGCNNSQTVSQQATYKDISAAELNEMISSGDYQLIDVREPHEFAEGYIKGAVNIPQGQLESRIGELSQDKPVIVYCRSGRRSAVAAELLTKHGFSEVYNLKGGILAWPYDLKPEKAFIDKYNMKEHLYRKTIAA